MIPKRGSRIGRRQCFRWLRKLSAVCRGPRVWLDRFRRRWTLLVAVKPGKEPEEAYRIKNAPTGGQSVSIASYVGTPVCRGNLMFIFEDRQGHASCLDAETGKVIWFKPRVGQMFFGSPVRAGDKVFVVDTTGTVICLAAERNSRSWGAPSLRNCAAALPRSPTGECMCGRWGTCCRWVGSNGDSRIPECKFQIANWQFEICNSPWRLTRLRLRRLGWTKEPVEALSQLARQEPASAVSTTGTIGAVRLAANKPSPRCNRPPSPCSRRSIWLPMILRPPRCPRFAGKSGRFRRADPVAD